MSATHRPAVADLEQTALAARALEDRALQILGADLLQHRAAEIARDRRPPDRTRGPLAESARRLCRLHPSRYLEAHALLHRADELLWRVVAGMDGLIGAVARQLGGRADESDTLQVARLAAFDALLRWQPEQGAIRQCVKCWIRARLQRAPDTQGDLRSPKDSGGAGRIYALRLDAPVDAADSDGARFVDLLPAPALTADGLAEEMDRAQMARHVRAAMATLPARTALIVEQIGEGGTLEATGRPLGISRERTRQVYQEGLGIVRRRLAEQGVAG